MVTVPCISHSFLRVLWDFVGKMKRAWHVVCLTDGTTVKRLQVYRSSGSAVSFTCDHYP
ncbi:hypothetical protein DPMN_180803 [Dreissena polymorpha]|uniref:Uncharacterized protein n=1 Tax=Dreissena polymorpha TaxID=45954 RepID=A0A9D4I0Z3_DREPO|nr:hypothetical protein DPMN_180803 [Dreissena polymorpha]